MKKVHERLTYANVVSTICLFILLGGGAYAATKLPKNSVGPNQLKKDAVTTAKIKNGAVTEPKLNLSTLGTVPEASHANSADHATSADRANSADRADSADRANSADTVGGQSVVKFARTGAVSLASPVTIMSLDG